MYRPSTPEHPRTLAVGPHWAVEPATARGIAVARRQVMRTLIGWGMSDLVDDALLIVSELVTNAIRHGEGPVWHALHQVVMVDGSTAVHFAVCDHGQGCDRAPQAPAPHGPGAEEDDLFATSGRGLAIVECLTVMWGATHVDGEHVVWADLPTHVPEDTAPALGPETTPSAHEPEHAMQAVA
ncbi:ATP-binding protein [Streptomyces sp. NPDC058486]|uniref:ATP-binding protein n=1 Tax=unclassified Streptomyces TaxID=2593676 RepID=UPI003646C7A1